MLAVSPDPRSGPVRRAAEPNETSEAATDLRQIGARGYALLNQGIFNTRTGRVDYDWFRFAALTKGRLAVRLSSPLLELHLYVRRPGRSLEEVRNGARVAAGTQVYVQVKGRQLTPQRLDAGGLRAARAGDLGSDGRDRLSGL